MDERAVSLEQASERDATLLSNLLELYIHDLSAAFPNVVLGADGRFGYPKLPLYWSEPERRFALLIRHGASLAGFTLVTRGSPASSDPDVFDVAEFFVLRAHRREKVGSRAAALLWRSFPGQWTVRVSATNSDGLVFWQRAVSEFSRGVAEKTRPEIRAGWRVFCFDSRRV